MTVEARARPLCPRCRRPGFRSHDEWWCFEHGPYEMPFAAHDPAQMKAPDPGDGRVRRRDPFPGGLVRGWSSEELREWETWQEGDPLPAWARSETEEAYMADGEITGNQLAESLRRRMRTLGQEVDELLGALEEKRAEAAKIEGYFAYIGEPIEVPDSLQTARKPRGQGANKGKTAPKLAEPVWCCGKQFDTPQGIATHRRHAGHVEAS